MSQIRSKMIFCNNLNNWICLLIVTLHCVLIECFIKFPMIVDDYAPNIDDKCLMANGQEGICTEMQKCQQNSMRRRYMQPTLCSYNVRGPVICCEPRNKMKKRISELKCDEYKSIVTNPSSSLARSDGIFVVSVVGGDSTKLNEFPHMAAIGFNNIDGKVEWSCGASLISKNFVLTAAHCTSLRGNQADVVRISDRNLYTSVDDMNVQERKIIQIFRHPKYQRDSTYHDIALIKLDSDIQFNAKLRPACLWTSHNINQTSAIATGWGLTEYAGKASEDLLKVDLEIFDHKACRDYYGIGRRFRNGIITGQLCAGDPNGNKDTCEGDSGGGLQVKSIENGEPIYHIIGITSFGKACGMANNPSVYTRVSSYIDWIESIVWM